MLYSAIIYRCIAVSDTKLDESFSTNQFILPGYKTPLRLDCSNTSEGLLVYVKADILMRPLTSHIFGNFPCRILIFHRYSPYENL